MDVGTGLTALGASQVLLKVLGPTADYLGENTKEWVIKRQESFGRIISMANEKLGENVSSLGVVPPRVLKEVIEEGTYSENELTEEYFAGILAASRSEDGIDDAGISYAKLVGTLSNTQVRAHYVIYKLLSVQARGSILNIGMRPDRKRLRLYVPYSVFSPAMGESFIGNIDHIIVGLHQRGLIEPEYSYGDLALMKRTYPDAKSSGIQIVPSVLGVELFMWAHGKDRQNVREFLKETSEYSLINPVIIKEGAELIYQEG